MPDMKIHRITVTDSTGVDHTWEGVEGWLSVRSVNKKGQTYQQAIDAHLALEPDPSVRVQPGER
jgi:hypothetical protein